VAVIKIGDDGKRFVNRRARFTALVAGILSLVGVVSYGLGDVTGSIFMILCGNTLATIHNLADDS